MEKIIYFFIIISSINMFFLSFVMYEYSSFHKMINYISKLSPLFIFGTLLVGINQIRLNRKQNKETKEWNKKQLATVQIHKVRGEIKKTLQLLDKYFKEKGIKSITDRGIEETFSLEEIHLLFGNGKYKPSNDFEFSENGEKVRRLLLNFLGEYEYIAASTNLGIFDKSVVKEILSYNIIRTYFVMKEYIEHIRNEHAKNDSIYIELQKLAEEFYEEEKKEKR